MISTYQITSEQFGGVTLASIQARYLQALMNELGEEPGSEDRRTLKRRTARLGCMVRALQAREEAGR